jgi:ferredoxin/flavodoxin---NADP+ reductase
LKNNRHQVLQRRQLTEQTFVLRFERKSMAFQPGQYLNVGLPDDGQQREYSIYSGQHHDFLEILVQSIPTGYVSSRLSQLNCGDPVLVEGPHGSFTLAEPSLAQQKFTFIATGTGIAPFHCFAQSHDHLEYHILHGIRQPTQRYEHYTYPPECYTPCLTQGQNGGYHGRVTDYLKEHSIDLEGQYYLCGNSDMIYEVFSLLTQHGVSREKVFTEVYF